MTTSKPTEIREFWIDLNGSKEANDDLILNGRPREKYADIYTHVIEYAVYEQLQKDKHSNDTDYLKLSAENNKLREQVKDYELQLSFYATFFGSEGVGGKRARNVLKKWEK